ncbi:MAG: hypothetical protein PHE15_00615 [Dehalococcoidales bacterium]|nr:hypothetical protein [Dehalococcoidales bacterium]
MNKNFGFFSGLPFFLVYLGKHIVCPIVRNRNFLNNYFHLFSKIFFPQIFFITDLLFLGATIIIVSFLGFRSYKTTAIPAFHKSGKSKFVLSLPFFLAPIIHYLLNRIKKFLGNNWLVRALINFAVEFENAVVKWIFQHSLDTGTGKNIAFVAINSRISQKLLNRF